MVRFIGELASTPYQWRLQSGLIRTVDLKVRCPETATARHLTGRTFSNNQWIEAAAAIGQPSDEADAVVTAADNSWGHNPALRALLLAATVNRPAPQAPRPAPDPMDAGLNKLLNAEGGDDLPKPPDRPKPVEKTADLALV